MNNHEIPSPAYWAITEKNGAQLIEQDSPLHSTILENVNDVETHGIIDFGDILVVSKESVVISPESIGIKRETISGFNAEKLAKDGLLKSFHS